MHQLKREMSKIMSVEDDLVSNDELNPKSKSEKIAVYETKSKARKSTYFIITDREKKVVVQPFPFHKKRIIV